MVISIPTIYLFDLTEKAKLLQTAHALVSLNKPSSSEYTSVVNFVEGNRPLVTAERNFIWRKEDLVILRPGREYAWLDSFIEKLLKWCNCSLLDVSLLII